MDFKKLLENKILLASIVGGIVLLLIVFIICGTIAASSKSKNDQIDVSKEPLKEDVDLLTTDNLGKALEIQALLARNNIVAARAVDGTKSVLRLKKGDCTPGMKKCTTEQRDRAIMVIVESGLYQEAKKMCYGKWNFPAGRLEFKESLKQGAIREIKEETGCDVELNGVCYIANRILEDDLRIMVFFNAKLVNENIKYDKNEILDVKWIGYDEIMNKMDDELRGSYVKTAVYNKKNNLIAPIEIVDVLND